MVFDFDEFIRRMRRMFKDFEREFAELGLGGLEREPRARGFRIEIRDHGTGKPEVKITEFGRRFPRPIQRKPKPEEPAPKPPAKPVARVLETNVGKIERAGEVVLTIQAPGVRKEDVEVRWLGNSVEVIARKPTGEAYFSAFELPADVRAGEHSIEVKDGMLVVIIPRRRRFPTS